MKFFCISDTHRQEKRLDLPKADLVIHAGDMDITSKNKFIEFLDWFQGLDCKYKVFIGGNHDKSLDENHKIGLDEDVKQEILSRYESIYYLEDSSVTIEGVNIYGSPYTPKFGTNWAFQLNHTGLDTRYVPSKEKWELIPEDTDIVVTHGPPKNILDLVETFKSPNRGENVGDFYLRERIEKIKPKFHVFGHIHEGAGVYKDENTTFINASVLDEMYEKIQKEFVIYDI